MTKTRWVLWGSMFIFSVFCLTGIIYGLGKLIVSINDEEVIDKYCSFAEFSKGNYLVYSDMENETKTNLRVDLGPNREVSVYEQVRYASSPKFEKYIPLQKALLLNNVSFTQQLEPEKATDPDTDVIFTDIEIYKLIFDKRSPDDSLITKYLLVTKNQNSESTLEFRCLELGKILALARQKGLEINPQDVLFVRNE